jgi:hypothetical protein
VKKVNRVLTKEKIVLANLHIEKKSTCGAVVEKQIVTLKDVGRVPVVIHSLES